MEKGECKLCRREDQLQLSHVLPAFVFKWQRATSGNGHLRSTAEPNARVQDGIKKYWLCVSCEELFSRSERSFATNIFHPYTERSGQEFPYGPWLLHFCASVSWRLAILALENGTPTGWTMEESSALFAAELSWREYLLGQRAHPGEFRQHLLPVDQLIDAGSMEPNINRYMMRAINLDICQGAGSVFTYAKLGRFMIFGSALEKHPDRWKGTKVNANKGIVGPKTYVIPAELRQYWNKKAKLSADAMDSVSARQKQKIAASFQANIDRYAGSDAFAAMQADVETFGAAAFRAQSPE